jgi:hypothetical protein
MSPKKRSLKRSLVRGAFNLFTQHQPSKSIVNDFKNPLFGLVFIILFYDTYVGIDRKVNLFYFIL